MKSYKDAVGEDVYGDEDIERCAAIVDAYLAAVGGGAKLSEQEILAHVEKAVLDLNELNDKCGGALIETDQREYLCELILRAARDAGLDTDEDITEEWREW